VLFKATTHLLLVAKQFCGVGDDFVMSVDARGCSDIS